MKPRAVVLILIFAGFLVRPVLAQNACTIQCMQLSGCWSGRSVTDPNGCSNMPQLCDIQCKGKAANSWGAIAYSKKERIAGWSYEKDDKVSAEHTALEYCVHQGGGNCVLEASFNHSCGAVAADGEAVGWGTSDSKAGAQQRALAECSRGGAKKCAIQTAVCSAPNASSAPPSAPPLPKAVAWGAIAYSSQDMGAGWSQGKADRASAEKEAMNVCAQRGKACVLETAFNKQCGALAADRNFTGFATAPEARDAQQKAIDECKKAGGAACVLHILFCSM